MKTVRFTQVVERCGRPRVHTLWTTPQKDPELTRARKTGRVMTVHRERGKTDVGEIGLASTRDGRVQILVFPKSLARFAGARIVGIKFELVEQPKLVPATSSRQRSRPIRRARAVRRPAPIKPKPHGLRAGVREALAQLEKGNSAEARALLRRAVAHRR